MADFWVLHGQLTMVEQMLGNRAQAEFDGSVESVGAARAFVADRLDTWKLGELSDAAVLLTSEIVTNAVLHARTPYRLTVEYTNPELVVEVADTCHDLPRPIEPHAEAERGRGLWLVDQLSERWGTALLPEGKVLWFVLLAKEVPYQQSVARFAAS